MGFNIVLQILIICFLFAVVVSLVILFNKFSRLIKEAETTLSIVNKELPAIMMDSRKLISHAEESLQELDQTLKSINEPLNNIKNFAQFGKKMMGTTLSKIPFSLGESHHNPELKRILIGALSGIIITLISKFINRNK